jgi:hypothetical protein
LYTLAELNIKSLNLNATQVNIADNGNTIGLMSSFTTNDGGSHQMADVWFASASGTEASTAQMTVALNSYASNFSANSGSGSGTVLYNVPQQQMPSVSDSLSQLLTQTINKYGFSSSALVSQSGGGSESNLPTSGLINSAVVPPGITNTVSKPNANEVNLNALSTVTNQKS